MRTGVRISERRACGLVEIARSTVRRSVVESEPNQALQARIIDLGAGATSLRLSAHPRSAAP